VIDLKTESRGLTTEEIEQRMGFEHNLERLMEAEELYWQQRGVIGWSWSEMATPPSFT
jgi:hypothetical protein